MNFATYDLLKSMAYPIPRQEQSVITNMAIGALSGTIAQTVCCECCCRKEELLLLLQAELFTSLTAPWGSLLIFL